MLFILLILLFLFYYKKEKYLHINQKEITILKPIGRELTEEDTEYYYRIDNNEETNYNDYFKRQINSPLNYIL